MPTKTEERQRGTQPAVTRTALLPFLLAAGLTACGPEAPPRDPSKDIVTYRCGDDTEFVAYFFAASPRAKVELDGVAYDLEQVPDDLGIAFSDGTVQLAIFRDQAELTGTPRGDLLECVDVDDKQVF